MFVTISLSAGMHIHVIKKMNHIQYIIIRCEHRNMWSLWNISKGLSKWPKWSQIKTLIITGDKRGVPTPSSKSASGPTSSKNHPAPGPKLSWPTMMWDIEPTSGASNYKRKGITSNEECFHFILIFFISKNKVE